MGRLTTPEQLADAIIKQIAKNTDPETIVENTEEYLLFSSDPHLHKALGTSAGLVPAYLCTIEDEGDRQTVAALLARHIIENQERLPHEDVALAGLILAKAPIVESTKYDDVSVLYPKAVIIAETKMRQAETLEKLAIKLDPQAGKRLAALAAFCSTRSAPTIPSRCKILAPLFNSLAVALIRQNHPNMKGKYIISSSSIDNYIL